MKSNNFSCTENFQPLRAEPAQSPTLPGFFYHRNDVFEVEKEKIFYKSWQLIAHVSQLKLPGDFVCSQIVDENIFVIRGQDGGIRAFYNVCQHRAHELLEGQGCVKSGIVCPYHNWSYDTEGELRNARHYHKQQNFDKADYSLVPIQVQEKLGFVFVNLEPAAQPIESLSGSMFEDIRTNAPWWNEMVISPELSSQSSQESIVNANWKVLAENCAECYHCHPSHPAYADMIDVNKFKWEMHKSWLKGFGKVKKLENQAYNLDPAEPSQMTMTWRLWPNIAFSIFPGEASLTAFSYCPVTPDLTRMASIILTRPGETIKSDRMNYRWNTLWPEDIGICQSVHRGLKSRGYSQGRFIIDPDLPGISEDGPHFLQLRYAEAMGLSTWVSEL